MLGYHELGPSVGPEPKNYVVTFSDSLQLQQLSVKLLKYDMTDQVL